MGTEKWWLSGLKILVHHKQLAGEQRDSRIGSTVIIHKLHLKHTRTKRFHQAPHLPALQTSMGISSVRATTSDKRI